MLETEEELSLVDMVTVFVPGTASAAGKANDIESVKFGVKFFIFLLTASAVCPLSVTVNVANVLKA